MNGASILVVEDSATQALALSRLLQTAGYQVACVDSAEAALERMNSELPDLVVADFHLPGMDGRELARQLRLSSRTRSLPILMLTGARELDLERQGLESGADAYVPKAADPQVVLSRLRALLRRQRSHAISERRYEPFRRARLMVVHDSAVVRLRLRQILEQEGYEVTESLDGTELLAETAPAIDCVLAPLSGSGLDGLALCHELDARREALADPFQIVALGDDAGGVLSAAFDAGADEVAPLSGNGDMLRVRVRALMRRKLLAEEARRAEQDLVEREVAMATAEAKAASAEALARANAELELANQQLREAQSQLVQAAKMASLGELVAGIAHEINNPLAFILGHQDTVERELAKLSGRSSEDLQPQAAESLRKAGERLASMRLGLKRIQSLVRNLRKFSRMEGGDRQALDVPDGVDTVLALLAPKLAGIEVRRDYGAAQPLQGSPALLNQVVMNIVGNAADALGGQGVIAIRTRIEDGCYLIEVGDSGPGVPKDLRDRIFEPFFTTKPVGAGTGLGLSIAYRIVEAHGGRIDIRKDRLGGACFAISVPLEAADHG